MSDEVEVEHLKTLTKDDVIDFYHVSWMCYVTITTVLILYL